MEREDRQAYQQRLAMMADENASMPQLYTRPAGTLVPGRLQRCEGYFGVEFSWVAPCCNFRLSLLFSHLVPAQHMWQTMITDPAVLYAGWRFFQRALLAV